MCHRCKTLRKCMSSVKCTKNLLTLFIHSPLLLTYYQHPVSLPSQLGLVGWTPWLILWFYSQLVFLSQCSLDLLTRFQVPVQYILYSLTDNSWTVQATTGLKPSSRTGRWNDCSQVATQAGAVVLPPCEGWRPGWFKVFVEWLKSEQGYICNKLYL